MALREGTSWMLVGMWEAGHTLGLQGAKGSSSQGFTMALLLPASFMKK